MFVFCRFNVRLFPVSVTSLQTKLRSLSQRVYPAEGLQLQRNMRLILMGRTATCRPMLAHAWPNSPRDGSRHPTRRGKAHAVAQEVRMFHASPRAKTSA